MIFVSSDYRLLPLITVQNVANGEESDGAVNPSKRSYGSVGTKARNVILYWMVLGKILGDL